MLEIPGKITAYSARNSFAYVLKRYGTPSKYISETLGHTNIQTIANYSNPFEYKTKVHY